MSKSIEGFPDSGVVYAFSGRQAGNMSLLYGDTRNSLVNRKVFLKDLNIEYRDLACAKQVHGDRVACISEADKGKGALIYDTSFTDTDAFITDNKNLPLAIFTADCLSVFLYDPVKKCIALIHAGWRSSVKEISIKTVRLMKEKFNTRPENLYAGFGPVIRECCYQVGPEFKSLISYGITQKGNSHYLNLVKVNKKQLLDTGVSNTNIFDSGICTSCKNNDFFSYRKEKKACGRMISVAMLK